MLNKVRRRLVQKHHEKANEEIQKLRQSMERLSLAKNPSIRVRLSLRVYEHTYRKGSLLVQLYGTLAGLWLVMPFVIALDDRPGSMRDTLTIFAESARKTLENAPNSGELVASALRISLGAILVVAYYAICAIGPILLGYRVGLGFDGIYAPGRKTIISCRKGGPIYACYAVLGACADVIGKNGPKRSEALHKVTANLGHLRGHLKNVHRFTRGFKRRRRRATVRSHALRVNAYLRIAEESVEEMTDADLKELGATILTIAEQCANERYGSILDGEKIANLDISDQGSMRLMATTLAALGASAASIYAINMFNLPSSLEPYAVTFSVLASSVIGYGRRAVQKIALIRGMLGQ